MRQSGWVVSGFVIAMSATICAADPAHGQLSWETPTLYAPGAPAGLGIFLMEPWPSGGIGVMGTYRSAPVPSGLGFRAGVGEDFSDDIAFFGGVDLGGTVTRASGEVPIDVLWMAGAGLGVGDDVLLSFPLGLSIGARLDADAATFVPYAVPRLVLDACLGDDPFRGLCGNDDDIGLDIAVDLGVDLAFDSRWLIRFAATLGDRDALLIGLAFPN
jgi:hypothetical protein